MREFVEFLTQFGFPAPELMAPLCVWAQFLCGIAFILDLTRWAGLVATFVFIIAVWMVHWPEPFPGWMVHWPEPFPGWWPEIGRAQVGTPVTNAHLVCRLLLEKQKK